MRPDDKRLDSRVGLDLPVQISIGAQLTIQGRLKDLSSKGAFVMMKSSLYLEMNEEVGFSIQCEPEDDAKVVKGLARISRFAVGEGLAIYFTKMDDKSAKRLDVLLK